MVKVEEFEAREPWPIVREPDPKHAGGFRFRVHIRESPPSLLGLIFGDFIHNLRASLDNLIYELAPPRTRRRTKLSFPIYDKEDAFDREARPLLQGVGDEVVEVLERFQPYPGPNEDLEHLRVLNAFWNQDKHRVTVPMALRSDVMTIGGWTEPDQIPVVDAYFGPCRECLFEFEGWLLTFGRSTTNLLRFVRDTPNSELITEALCAQRASCGSQLPGRSGPPS
jgi:hypothetical protein